MATRRAPTRRRTVRRRNPNSAALNQATGVVDALDASFAHLMKGLERLAKLQEELEAEGVKPTAKMRSLHTKLMALRLKVAGVGSEAIAIEREVYRMAGGE